MKFSFDSRRIRFVDTFFLLSVLEDMDYYNVFEYDTYKRNYGPKIFKGAGTTFLFKKRNNKETITAPGPLNEKLQLVVSIHDNASTFVVKEREIHSFAFVLRCGEGKGN